MEIVFLGPPGSGKGTQGERMARDFGFVRISTGDMLRDHAARETDLGKRAKSFMDRGELVPDEVILGMIAERLGDKNIVFDGFPRNMEQAEALEKMLSERGEALDAVVIFDVPKEVIIRRLTARRVCRDCGAIYNLITSAPKKNDACDLCGGHLYQRDDDTLETVVHRFMIYQKMTAPIIEFYRTKRNLIVIDAMGSPDEIYERLKEALGL